jgi:hypothetical protein
MPEVLCELGTGRFARRDDGLGTKTVVIMEYHHLHTHVWKEEEHEAWDIDKGETHHNRFRAVCDAWLSMKQVSRFVYSGGRRHCGSVSVGV